MTRYDWISFTTDYGLADGFVAACHGVMARIAPHARVIDVTHQIPAGDIRRGALVMAQTLPYLPPAVHVAVVDPGVGTDRKPIALATDGGILVGPDNGLLPWAAEALGGVRAAVVLDNPELFMSPLRHTFHGRDIFAPVAAHLAAGRPLSSAGSPYDPAALVRLPDPRLSRGEGWVQTEVLAVDGFGNIQLAGGQPEWEHLGDLVSITFDEGTHTTAAAVRARKGTTFGSVGAGELVLYVDSADQLSIALNGGDAASLLQVTPGRTLRLTTVPS